MLKPGQPLAACGRTRVKLTIVGVEAQLSAELPTSHRQIVPIDYIGA
jgi:hypothetical protein